MGNRVWDDLNNDGLIDAGESGIDGLTVRLYRDSNDDGTPDDVDGTAGVTTADAILTVTTASGGYYLFTDLGADTYIVEVDTPAGMRSSTGQSLPTPYEPAPDPDTGGALAPDSDDNGTTSGAVVRSAPVTLSLGAEPTGEPATLGFTETADDANANYTVDFGFYTALSLGNRVWEDRNNNGIIDDGASPGIDGVDVRLYRDNDGDGQPDDVNGGGVDTTDAIASTTTAGGGYYRFTNLSAGGYIVEIAPAASYRSSTGTTLPWPYEPAPDPDTGLDGTVGTSDDDADSDDNGTASGAVIRSATVTLSVGGEPTGETDTVGGDATADDNSNLTVDFGLYQPVSLGDLVFIDRDNNGTFDGSDSPLQGAAVDLFLADGTTQARASDGTPVATITTPANGLYLFSNLPAGDYVVRVTPPAGYRSSDDIASSASPNNNSNNDDNGIGDSVTTPVSSNPITLSSGQEINDGDSDPNSNPSLDFGFYQPLSLGDLVFIDRDNNGTFDGTDSPLAGASVDLFFDANGNGTLEDNSGSGGVDETIATATQTTAADGLYLFTNLKPGGYIVRVTPPAGYSSSDDLTDTPNPNSNTNDDDNGIGVGATASSNLITLSSGEEPDGAPDHNSNLTLDFGFHQPASLGDFVWHDQNANGVQDAGEPGIDGVTVTLQYAGPDGAFGTADDNLSAATTTTAGGGAYSFTGLIPGFYRVQFSLPAGFDKASPTGKGTDTTDDSDADPTTLRTAATDLASGEIDPTWDAGFYSLVRLGNQVWDDLNNDGTFDSLTESGISGVTVELSGTNGLGDTVTLTTTTNISGTYSFDSLIPGEYVVALPASNFTGAGALAATATMPAYVSSTGTNGSATGDYEGTALADPDGDIDSDDSGNTDGSGNVASLPVTLTSQSEPDIGVDTDDTNGNLTLDFGVFRPLSLGNLVWDDLNNDGQFDSGTESGINGVTVDLYLDNGDGSYGAGDTFVISDTTKLGGVYGFTKLIPGDYIVVIPASNFATGGALSASGAMPAYISSSGTNGSLTGAYEPAPDPDADQDNHDDGSLTGGDVVSMPITLDLDSEPDSGVDGDDKNGNQTVDFGFFKPARLGNFVWDDLNGNGVQDAGESGVNGVTVTLYDASNSQVATTTTAGGGLYSFDNLAAGDYRVVFSGLPPSYVFSPTGQGTSATDSDASPADGGTATITLSAGQTDLDWDAGIYHTLSLGNLVWDDLNNDGQFDSATESGINGVTVELRRASDNSLVGTTTTAGGGLYQFSGLAQGDYIVVLPASNFSGVLSGYRSSTGAHSLTAGPSEPAPDPDDPTGAPAANDKNNDDNGSLIGGSIQSAPVSLSALGEPDVADDGDDTNGNQTVDFGLFKPASIGDRVWEDADGNGLQDTGELGVSGVIVTLYDAGADGIPGGGDDLLVDSTPTDGSGIYGFSDLPPASYYLVFDKPTGYLFTRRDAGGDDAIDSDADRTSGETIATTLTSGESDDSWDAGINQLASLGDTVWEDMNHNGVQDAGEPGVPGVTVTLYNTATGQVGTPQITDADGFYQFIGLPPDRYYLVFSGLPAGYSFTLQSQGGNSSKDSDADPASGRTSDIDLLSSQDDPTWDAGIYTTASMGDRVWNDLDANGVQDAGEVGVNDVTVTLYQADGTLVSSSTTATVGAEDGIYSFSGLTPGDYYVVFSNLPAGYIFSPADRGTDDSVDSDADRAIGQSATFALASGANDLSWDAGIYLPASLGDFIWDDANANGVQDSGELGVSSVTMRLIQGGAVISTTTTASDGSYHFRELGAGDYQIEVVRPTGRQISPQLQGGDTATDSDIDRASMQSGVVSLTPGEVNDSLDGGIYQLASVGNHVWEDSNHDGIFGAGEAGIPGVTVELYRSDGSLVASAVTDSTGAFIFIDLEPGDYYIQFYPPSGWLISPQDQGGDNSIDSDANPNSGKTKVFTLGIGVQDLTWWAGMSRPPTAITLQSFTLERQRSGNLLRWETGAEINSAGFEIYRSATGSRADAEQVSGPLILSSGVGGGGARYSWLDSSADPQVGYSYWLVEVEIGGARHEYELNQPALQQEYRIYMPLVVR
nr:SdrD B-like domain-containing protein [Oscillochloris sp. ZM17-4]